MARQLTFDLAGKPALGRDDFLVTPANALAVAMLDQPSGWPQGRMLLIGPDGSGKTHLTTIWAEECNALRVSAVSLQPDMAVRLVTAGGAVAVEDVHQIGGMTGAEQGLFHLWNLCAAHECRLLLTARTPPRDWGLVLPDVSSRMAALPVSRIEAPDEPLLAAVLVKLFSDRQISVPAGLIDWLAPRMDRDLGLARRLVAALDAEAMANQRALTRNLAADLLGQLSQSYSIPTKP
ncbi:MAG: chromosomal replication initiator DnaA [Paracoccus sp. (in: a-proteobacteria)]